MPNTDAAWDSLTGLSVGDALGAQFFVPGRSVPDLRAGRPPAPPWQWTDDTEMACSVYAEVRDRGHIDRDALATVFADRCEPYRGYGAGTVVVLHEIRDGRPWADAAGDYPAAVTACVEAGGDADTTAAIAGGIVAAHTGVGHHGSIRGIPEGWRAARESLPAWLGPR